MTNKSALRVPSLDLWDVSHHPVVDVASLAWNIVVPRLPAHRKAVLHKEKENTKREAPKPDISNVAATWKNLYVKTTFSNTL
jgi:hypothetical protein